MQYFRKGEMTFFILLYSSFLQAPYKACFFCVHGADPVRMESPSMGRLFPAFADLTAFSICQIRHSGTFGFEKTVKSTMERANNFLTNCRYGNNIYLAILNICRKIKWTESSVLLGGTEAQRHRGTEAQRHRGTEGIDWQYRRRTVYGG